MGWYGVHSGVVNNSGDRWGALSANLKRYSGALGGPSGGSADTPRGVAIDASLSSAIYGRSTTVTPLSYSTVLMIKY